MAKKKIDEKVELIKFIKSLYTDEIALNFEDYFSIVDSGNETFYISFPNNKYCLLCGKIDMRDCTSFYNWLHDSNSEVLVNNTTLDELRKRKLGDFQSLSVSDEKYSIELSDSFFELEKTPRTFNPPKFHFINSIDIPANMFDGTTITVYENDSGLTFEPTQDVVFDSAIKNINIIFKKNASYKLYVTDNVEGFRIVMLEGAGEKCTLNQYFKVI